MPGAMKILYRSQQPCDLGSSQYLSYGWEDYRQEFEQDLPISETCVLSTMAHVYFSS